MRRSCGQFVLWMVLAAAGFATDLRGAEWAFDEIRLKNGIVHRGILLEESPTQVRFRMIRRSPGKPTFWLTMLFARSEVDKLTKLAEADRAVLKSRLEEIDPSGQVELRKMEQLDLKPAPWLDKPDGALRYESEYYTLISDAPEEIVRRASVRLDQVYAAYSRYLPPRYPGGAPTTIRIFQSVDGYQKSLPAGIAFRNPAYYDPATNRVVCGTDLARLGADLADFRSQAAQLLAELKDQEDRIIRLYGKKPELDRHLQPLRESRARVKAAARTNEEAFERATRQLFRVLYHEAFHAYVGHFVFPHAATACELPRWLNEGLAQIFETAIFEAGELRVGHADPVRLEKARDLLAKQELPTVRELLAAKSNLFIVAHSGVRQETDRAYVATWAVASYLLFDRQILRSDQFPAFLKTPTDVATFEKLIGQPVDAFEKAFHDWLKRLKPDGTLWEK
jgi:Protein of unknown function (DUF1570)